MLSYVLCFATLCGSELVYERELLNKKGVCFFGLSSCFVSIDVSHTTLITEKLVIIHLSLSSGESFIGRGLENKLCSLIKIKEKRHT